MDCRSTTHSVTSWLTNEYSRVTTFEYSAQYLTVIGSYSGYIWFFKFVLLWLILDNIYKCELTASSLAYRFVSPTVYYVIFEILAGYELFNWLFKSQSVPLLRGELRLIARKVILAQQGDWAWCENALSTRCSPFRQNNSGTVWRVLSRCLYLVLIMPLN